MYIDALFAANKKPVVVLRFGRYGRLHPRLRDHSALLLAQSRPSRNSERLRPLQQASSWYTYKSTVHKVSSIALCSVGPSMVRSPKDSSAASGTGFFMRPKQESGSSGGKSQQVRLLARGRRLRAESKSFLRGGREGIGSAPRVELCRPLRLQWRIRL
jgi:hypothetical protein